MGNKLTYKEFQKIYFKHFDKVIAFNSEEMQQKISKHNIGWNRPYSFESYLEKSVVRFYKAYLNIPDGVKSCCDIGGFWGLYPLVLNEIGYTVSMTESLKFYDNTFDGLFNYIKENGVEIIDIDPFNENFKSPAVDYISVLAVIEHIPSSIKFFMENIKNHLTEEGSLYIEVPNIAYYAKRIDLLFGKTPLPDILAIYNSATPFIGHFHEYTMDELMRIFKVNDFEIKNKEYFNYSYSYNLIKIIRRPARILANLIFPNTREIIAILGKK